MQFPLRVARSGESSVKCNNIFCAVPLYHCVPLALTATSAVAITNIAFDAIAVITTVTDAVNADASTTDTAVTAAIVVANAGNGVVDDAD